MSVIVKLSQGFIASLYHGTLHAPGGGGGVLHVRGGLHALPHLLHPATVPTER